jgi:RNA polymerase sigma-70 factor (ECF subfamily)
MSASPETRPSLLRRVRDARDQAAWAEFVETYAPVVFAYARRHGLQEADASDLTQDVLLAVVRAIGSFDYDPERGTFRGWLFAVARSKLADRLARPAERNGDSHLAAVLLNHPAPDDEELRWNEEYERHLFARAVEAVRGRFGDAVWQAFWRTAVEGKEVDAVAAELGLSLASVYTAKCRVLAALRDQVQQLQ